MRDADKIIQRIDELEIQSTQRLEKIEERLDKIYSNTLKKSDWALIAGLVVSVILQAIKLFLRGY